MRPERQVSPRVWAAWRPRPRVASWDWICQNVRAPNGAPFDGDSFPWCRGVCEAFDNPHLRQIVLQWATRLGKTFICQALGVKTAATNPLPAIFASSREKLATDIVRRKFYPMLEHCRDTREQLRPAGRRSVYRVDLAESHWRVAWSGSDSTLADFGAWLIHCNELDKWSDQASSEADPVELVAERCKEFPDHKMLFEGSPAEAFSSRLAAKCRIGTLHLFYVPCLHCRHWQVLRIGLDDPHLRIPGVDHAQPGGIIWDTMAVGVEAGQIAYDTARYQCEACGQEIHDEQRARFVRGGVWAAEGQSIDSKGRVTGTPRRPTEIWAAQQSSFYSLQLRWGDIARRYAQSREKPRQLQNFVNGWSGLTYTADQANTTADELARRLGTEIPQGTVPEGTAFLTAGVDAQEGYYVWQIHAWRVREQSHLVDFGNADSDAELLAVLDRIYQDQAGHGWPVPITLIDSSAFTREIYGLCKANSRRGRLILPAKGANHEMAGEAYQKKIVGAKRSRSTRRRAALLFRGLLRIAINVDFWEAEVEHALAFRRPGQTGSLTLCREAAADADLLAQLLNGARSLKLNSRNQEVPLWIKRNPDEPNDHRDVYRMARVAAELYTRGNWGAVRARQSGGMPAAPPPPPAADPSRTPPRRFIRQPDRSPGQPFVRRRRR